MAVDRLVSKEGVVRVARERWGVAVGEEKRRLGVVLDVACHKRGELAPVDLAEERGGVLWSVLFDSPGFELLGLEGLLRRKEVGEVVPPYFKDQWPRVVYAYTHPIRKEILNYKRVLEDTAGLPLESIHCECKELGGWVNQDLGHVCTGDLSGVSDKSLRELLRKVLSTERGERWTGRG